MSSYRTSIKRAVLDVPVTARRKEIDDVDAVPEEHLKQCVKELPRKDPNAYDLAQVERAIKHVRKDRADKDLEMKV